MEARTWEEKSFRSPASVPKGLWRWVRRARGSLCTLHGPSILLVPTVLLERTSMASGHVSLQQSPGVSQVPAESTEPSLHLCSSPLAAGEGCHSPIMCPGPRRRVPRTFVEISGTTCPGHAVFHLDKELCGTTGDK